jgi:hypothetical protein
MCDITEEVPGLDSGKDQALLWATLAQLQPWIFFQLNVFEIMELENIWT